MRVHVKFFAIFREMTGIKTEWTEIAEGTTIEGLWKQYAERSPRLGNIRSAYAQNQRLVKPEQVLGDGDEVGFLPPVSGGEGKRQKAERGRQKAVGSGQKAEGKRQRAKSKRATPPRKKKIAEKSGATQVGDAVVTRKRLDLNALVERVAFPGAGAILTFSGVVRDNAHGKAVKRLEYEAYPGMAETTLRDIIAEIHERWPEARVAMAHRIGKLKIGEASLIIAVSTPHRPDAYTASRYAIERVKAILPVWKKEFGLDGDHWVEGPVAGELPPENAEQVARGGGAEYSPF